MRIPARPFASWRRLAAVAAALALTAAGAAAMWSGLPSHPIEWNDLNGRLVLGPPGADTTPDARRTASNWISGAPLSNSRADTSWLHQVSPAKSEGLPAPKADADRGSANWLGSSRKSQLSSTAGKSGLGGGVGKGSGGLGAGGAVTSAAKKSGVTVPNGPRAAKAAASSGGGNRSGGSSSSSGFSSQTTTVGDLVAGVVPGEPGGGMDLGGGGLGGGAPMAPTPEPSSLLLIGTGILGAAGMLRKRLR